MKITRLSLGNILMWSGFTILFVLMLINVYETEYGFAFNDTNILKITHPHFYGLLKYDVVSSYAWLAIIFVTIGMILLGAMLKLQIKDFRKNIQRLLKYILHFVPFFILFIASILTLYILILFRHSKEWVTFLYILIIILLVIFSQMLTKYINQRFK